MTGGAGGPGRAARPAEHSVLARLEADGRLTLNPCNLSDAEAQPSDAAGAALETTRSETRLEVLGEIARGGVGIVLRARDADLGRDVAMKVIRDEHLGNDDVLARFVEEAQIGGKLQHPGIVPVYELGLRPQGQPYFTMKLVKGRTFAEIFAERKDPADGRRRLLAQFEAVCHTIAYAHARGVVHRDLKPLNVMLGAFGEVQVVDWGLAKVLDQSRPESKRRPPAADVSIIETVRGGDSSIHSRVGSVLGTPAYMPPEQARGDVDAVDERSDVFALGAILCEILTGAAPYTGDAALLVQKAAEADLADALSRLDACGADPDLVSLAKSCLSPAPAARPKDAGAVGDRVAACFAASEQRARDAQIAAAAATVRANTAARSRRLAGALAATVVVAATAGIGGFLWFRAARAQRTAEADRAVDAELGQAATSRGRARASRSPADWADAVAAAKTAEATAASRGASESARSAAAAAAKSTQDEADAVAETAARDARDRAAVDHCEEIRLESWDVEESVSDARYADAFKPLGIDPERTTGEAAAAALQSSASVAALASALDAWADVRTSIGRPAGVLRAAARAADPDPWRTKLRDAKGRDELAKLAAEADLASLPPLTLVALGDALGGHGDVEGAVRLLEGVQSAHPGDFAVNSRYAYWLDRVRPRRAEETLRYALAALARRPGSAALWNNLGSIYMERNDRARAADAFDEALRLKPDFAAAHANRAKLALSGESNDAAARKPVLEKVVAECNAAIRLDKKCVTAYATLGHALAEQGDTDGALEALREGARVRADSSQAHQLVAVGLATMRRFAEAEAEFQKAIELDPANADAHAGLGDELLRRRDLDGAVVHWRTASQLEPDDVDALWNLAGALWEKRDAAASIDVRRRVVRAVPTESWPYRDLGLTLMRAGDAGGAVKAMRVVAMVAVGDHASHVRLAEALLDASDAAGANSELDDAVGMGAADCATCKWEVGRLRARAHLNAGMLTTATADLRRERDVASAAGPSAGRLAASMQRQVDLVERLQRMGPALASYVSGAATPENAEDRLAVAFLTSRSGRGARSSALFAAAFELDPSLLDDRVIESRSVAAFEAASAGTGRGDGAALGPEERSRLRRLALAWLRDELAAWERRLPNDAPAITGALAGWMLEPRIAGVRNLDDVAKLPAEERTAWDSLWRDVESLRKRATR
jgi:serine/threonine-protein kinase